MFEEVCFCIGVPVPVPSDESFRLGDCGFVNDTACDFNFGSQLFHGLHFLLISLRHVLQCGVLVLLDRVLLHLSELFFCGFHKNAPRTILGTFAFSVVCFVISQRWRLILFRFACWFKTLVCTCAIVRLTLGRETERNPIQILRFGNYYFIWNSSGRTPGINFGF